MICSSSFEKNYWVNFCTEMWTLLKNVVFYLSMKKSLSPNITILVDDCTRRCDDLAICNTFTYIQKVCALYSKDSPSRGAPTQIALNTNPNTNSSHSLLNNLIV